MVHTFLICALIFGAREFYRQKPSNSVHWLECSQAVTNKSLKEYELVVELFDPGKRTFIVRGDVTEALLDLDCRDRSGEALSQRQIIESDFVPGVFVLYKTGSGRLEKVTEYLDFKKFKDRAKSRDVVFLEKLPELESFNIIIHNASSTPGRDDYADLSGTESGLWALDVESLWQNQVMGQGEIISFADTGLSAGQEGLHPDLIENFIGGLSYIYNETDWRDDYGHGTNVAGLALGQGRSSNGQVIGVAPMAASIVQDIYSKNFGGFSLPGNLSEFFLEAYGAGSRIHVNSWGSSQDLGEYNGLSYDFDRFVWENPDMLFITAVGNFAGDWDGDGKVDLASIASPATAKNVLSVGANENLNFVGGIQLPAAQVSSLNQRFPVEPLASNHLSDNVQGLAPFSGRGPTLDGRTKPEVVAPGTNLLSTRSHAPGAIGLWGDYNEFYNWTGGTSMSAPLVAGMAALVRQGLKIYYSRSNPSASFIKALLMNSALDLYPGQYGEGTRTQEIDRPRPSFQSGFGMVQGSASLRQNKLVLEDRLDGLNQGQSQDYSFTLQQTSLVSMTLVWTDYPAAPGSETALVNDLDMVLFNENGQSQVYENHLDNFEHQDLRLSPGRYVLRVMGSNVPMGPQSYSLVISHKPQ